MPNGSPIDEELFKKLDAELSRIDPTIYRVANIVDGDVVRNHHGSPNRRIVFLGDDGITRSVMVTAVVFKPNSIERLPVPEYQFTVAAWHDDASGRRHWHQVVRRVDMIPVEDECDDLLMNMINRLQAVTDAELMN